MSKPWGGGIGAWAMETERAEAEELAAAAAASANSQSFPSLKEAATAKPKKKKPMTLAEFTTGTNVGPGGARRDYSMESKGLTTEEMFRLPTGPRERSQEEMDSGRLGGGFRSYGRTGPPQGRMRDRGDDSEASSWGGGRRSYGGFDDERRAPPSRVSDFDQPSRADEVDNWAVAKNSMPLTSMDSGRHDRYNSLGSGSGGGGSRADEVDNWAVGKKSLPTTRSTSFGSGFKDSAPDSDRWGRGGQRNIDHERPRFALDLPKGDVVSNESVKTIRPSPFGAARPREDVLAEKGLDWKKLDLEQSSRPSSAQSNRAESPATQVLEEASKSRQKVNPFGDAKPREILLEQKGKDWRKIDLELEHRGVDRPETDEEKMLREEIDHLKKEMEKEAVVDTNGGSLQGEQTTLHELILSKERDLTTLIRELDDKVRFGQKATDRPGSGGGRPGSGGGRVLSYPERQMSQSSASEESRNMEFMERPRSHGRGDVWTRPGDDKRAFQGSRERKFLGNRNIERSESRERW